MRYSAALIIVTLTLSGLAAPTLSIAQAGPAAIAIGSAVKAEIAAGDLQGPDTSYYDLYRFHGEATQALVITLTAPDFDPQLSLHKAGSITALAADSAEAGKIARVTIALPAAGDYEIRVVAPAGFTGAYTLTLAPG